MNPRNFRLPVFKTGALGHYASPPWERLPESSAIEKSEDFYAGRSKSCSMIFATPSVSHGSATALANKGASGWPSDIAYDRAVHSSIEKSLGLSPNETQSWASIFKRDATTESV